MPETKDLLGIEQLKVQPEQVSGQEQSSVEKEQSTEASFEASPVNDETMTEATASVTLPHSQITDTIMPRADIELKKVENILSQGLENVFLTMDIATQARFKKKGEETAKQINTLLLTGKARIQKIINLIIIWLRLIPQVNRHFLEQEAKLKADKIIRMYQKNNI